MKIWNAPEGRAGSPRPRGITKLMTPVLAAAVLSLASCGGGGQQEGQQEQQQGQQEQQGATQQQQGGGSTAAQGGGTTMGGTTMGGTTMAQGGTTMGGTTMAQGGTTMGGTTMGGTTMAQGGTRVSQITANPEQYYGQQVEVRGGLGQVIEPRALAMLDRRDLRGQGAIPESTITDRGLLVINTNANNPSLSERENIRVRGTLQPFDIAAIEQDLGVDLDDALYTEYEDRPVILADRVRPAQGGNTQMGGTTGQ